jgi:putative serine protease PepD
MRSILLVVAAFAVALLGAGAGAAIYSSLQPDATTTVVRNVTQESQTEPVAATTGLSISQAYDKTHQGVVDITDSMQTGSSFGQSSTASAEGSGFVYNKQGDIITNDHVVSGASNIKVTFWNGRTFKGEVIGTDPSTDLAVIHVSAPASLLTPLTLANSDKVQVGDGVIAIGSPFGYAQTVTSGIVSALHRQMTSPSNYVISDSIQTDAPINHGNSGGPLINTQGQVIGVNSQIQSASGDSAGVGFAVPSNTIRSVVSDLADGMAAQHAYIGVSIQDSTSAIAGAEIMAVIPGGPAAAAGLTCSDVITEMGGSAVGSSYDLTAILANHKPGDQVSTTYSRGGKSHTTTVKLANRPAGNTPTPSCQTT